MREWFFAGEECGQASGGPGSPAAALATRFEARRPGNQKEGFLCWTVLTFPLTEGPRLR